ncbi:MAG: hypothetical protein A2144_06685 [Chloroflexi bacterium RBG_16_50_9]|nr:MAG: hypothetical protein A2144_06685 [Chloroflexi bacterium RBG_16_50_9]
MKEKLRQLLVRRQKRHMTDPSRVPSAVLVPVYREKEQYHILFIKRTEKVNVHRGQISFPGGTREERDSTLLDTALRECEEETGLHARDVDILGELDDEVTTTSNYIVTPFVALIPWPYQFKPSPEEVQEIIGIPIPELLEKKCLHHNTEILNGKEISSYAYHCQGNVIWGATARILKKFLDIYIQASDS